MKLEHKSTKLHSPTNQLKNILVRIECNDKNEPNADSLYKILKNVDIDKKDIPSVMFENVLNTRNIPFKKKTYIVDIG